MTLTNLSIAFMVSEATYGNISACYVKVATDTRNTNGKDVSL